MVLLFLVTLVYRDVLKHEVIGGSEAEQRNCMTFAVSFEPEIFPLVL